MARTVALVAAAAGLAVTLLSIGAPAQGIPSKKEISELIYEAHAHRYLTNKNAEPFHLLANFRYASAGVTKSGTYELLWANPERFREEFRLGDDIGETDLALDGKLYVRRNTKFIPYALWRVRSLMFLPVKPLWANLESEVPVHTIKPENLNVFTVELGTKPGSNRVRLDFSTKGILSEETSFEQGKFKKTSLSDHYLDFESVRYPRHFLFTIRDETLEINLLKLEEAGSFADVVFRPPDDAAVRDWCSEPDIEKQRPSAATTEFFLVSSLQWAAEENGANYLLVAPDGHIETDARIYPDGTEKIGIPAKNSKPPSLPIRRCAGKPVEYEYVTQVVLLKP